MNSYIIVIVFIGLIVGLIIDKWKPSILFAGASIIFIAFEIVSPNTFLSGFVNESIVNIFLLVIITSIINENFDIVSIFDYLFKGAKTANGFVFRMGIAVSSLSSVVNNTPIVALMIPYVYQWGKRRKISPSLLLIPLSYMTILGGMITVIGTSTNLVLNGFMSSKGMVPLTFQDYLVPGILVTISGLIYISTIGIKLLPKNKDIIEEATNNLKEYLVETELEINSPLLGKTVAEGGLRNLNGIFLVEIQRGTKIISPVEPNETLMGGDKLFFAGETNEVIDLINKKNGLRLPNSFSESLGVGLDIIETVVPSNSELVGKTLKEIDFRNKFDAAVIAIHRNGEKLRGKIGELVLDKGDLLMLTVGKTFNDNNNLGKNLYLVSKLKKMQIGSTRKSLFFGIGFLAFSSLAIFGFISFFVFLLGLIGLSYWLEFTNLEHIKKQVNIELLIILGCSISLSNILIDFHISDFIANWFINIVGISSAAGAIIFLYLITVVLTSFITNAAAVAIIFPIAFSINSILGINPIAIFLAIAFGASCCFLTPIGYQTNLMVYGPGNYKFSDYIKVGSPLVLIYSMVSIGWIIYKYL
jgi:di/tricarboxylate transporter